jgi:hypothetical protein
MNDHHIRRLPVLDASGALIGMVAGGPAAGAFLRPDAEIGAEVHGADWRAAGGPAVGDGAGARGGGLAGQPREPGIPVALRLVATDIDGSSAD